MEKHTAEIGDFLKPDGWNIGELLSEGDSYGEWHCQFRVKTFNAMAFFKCGIPVNITITGSPKWKSNAGIKGMYVSRCKIEYIRDGEPSDFDHGFIYHKSA